MRVLFLDIDGTLGRPNAPMRDRMAYLPYLERLLREHQDVSVVISSSWRRTHPLERLRQLFPEDLRSRVIGVTPVLRYQGGRGHRQRECLAWLQENAPDARWLGIDDEALLYEQGGAVICDPAQGLSDPKALRELETWLGEAI